MAKQINYRMAALIFSSIFLLSFAKQDTLTNKKLQKGLWLCEIPMDSLMDTVVFYNNSDPNKIFFDCDYSSWNFKSKNILIIEDINTCIEPPLKKFSKDLETYKFDCNNHNVKISIYRNNILIYTLNIIDYKSGDANSNEQFTAVTVKTK